MTSKDFTLKPVLVDNNGNKIANLTTAKTVEAGELIICDQTSEEIADPELWSPENPALYKAYTYIYENDTLLDNYETSFGFRWMEWTADKGFFLNGEHVYFIHLSGTNNTPSLLSDMARAQMKTPFTVCEKGQCYGGNMEKS
jgi:hypothetical protein